MNISLLGRVWAWVKWPLLVLVVLFVGACIYFINLGGQIVRTREAVAKIHATRLTQDDVFGYFPLTPDQKLNDSTLAGIDSNLNGIRDDVEIAIVKAHKDSAKVGAAELQYAKELQMEFTDVFNSDTLVAVLQEESRGSLCLSDLKLKQEVRDLVFNTEIRKQKHDDIFQKYMTSYLLPKDQACDLQL